MFKFQIEEILSRISLVCKILKNSFLRNKNILFEEYKYGKNKRHYYHVYKGNDNNPIIFFIHGGGWWHGSPRMCRCIGKYFHEKGYTIVLPAYRLVPKFKYPTQIEDVFNALKHYLNNNDKDYKKRKIIVMGFSAGSELAANIVFNKASQKKWSVDKSIFKGFISLSGVLDFKKCTSKHSRTLIKNYLGKKSYLNKANPIELLNNRFRVPTLCIHGSRDPIINIKNSFSFINKVTEKGGLGEVQVVEGKHHSDIIELIMGKGQRESEQMFDFMNICK